LSSAALISVYLPRQRSRLRPSTNPRRVKSRSTPLTSVDSTQSSSRATIIDAAIENFGHLDILFNNSGVYEFSPIETFTEEHYNKMLKVNVLRWKPRQTELLRRILTICGHFRFGDTLNSNVDRTVAFRTARLSKARGVPSEMRGAPGRTTAGANGIEEVCRFASSVGGQ
jgi:NAD(P)-dependent dehydrogenase (short-subunit alcohol dehydrogenase family)